MPVHILSSTSVPSRPPPAAPHRPAHAPAPSAAVPAPHRALRLGTFNVGLGFLRKLPHILTRCAELALDVVALQEVGDPALLSSRFSSYLLAYAAGPSHHEAGVGLLLSQELAPRIRCYKRSSSGRLIGAVLELSPGQRTLLVSAYMPSGLDHRSADSAQHELAHKLYGELLGWSLDAQQVIVMGDLNETLTPLDRHPGAAAATAAAPLRPLAALSPIRCLVQQGFIDVFRHLHPLSPGFTHCIAGVRPVQSRLDYIWCKGHSPASLLRISIDTALHTHSHHHLLWMELRVAHPPPSHCSTPLLRLRLPNLRAATDDHKDAFAALLHRRLQRNHRQLGELASSADAAALSLLASRLTSLARNAAFASFPITGAAPYRSNDVLQLQHQRRALSSLLRLASRIVQSAEEMGHVQGDCLTRCPEWHRQYQHCVQRFQLHWRCDAWYGGDPHAWLLETQQLLGATRSAIRREHKRMTREQRPPLDASPAALVHRMLQSDALPSQLHSVVDPRGHLTTTAAELEAVMVAHFCSVFALPADAPAPLPHPPPPMLTDKASVEPQWYDGLMAEVDEHEILRTLAGSQQVTAPGQDGVSTGVWKIALQRSPLLCRMCALLFSGCLRTASFPVAWKTSIIVPLVKDVLKERSMTNVRPISLQSCLGKLFNKILAHRLSSIFARHPILHPSQRGFVHGGSIAKSIDELLDAWDWSREGHHELHTLFYDIRQAYDSVQSPVLTRAMQRLRMPPAFVALIADSLSGLSSCVRTAYAVSDPFEVQRSLRQGDPLAPLLFVVLMDGLHDGLERNPFTGQAHGLHMSFLGGASAAIPSLGYADDTAVLANTLPDLRVQNDWVHYFMSYNSLRLNHAKCELVGRGADGEPVTDAALALAGINIEGHSVASVGHSQPIRYLGIHCCFDGSWAQQRAKSCSMIQLFTRAATKFRVTINQAAFMFNTFLLPKLELALRYVHGRGTSKWVKNCDALIMGCIKHAAQSPLKLSHSALALTLRINLPSWLESAVKVSELFLRLNSTGCRWGHLGRLLWRQSLPLALDAALALQRSVDGAGSRLKRAADLASHVLGWSLKLHGPGRARTRRPHLFHTEPAGLLPDGSVCSLTQDLVLPNCRRIKLAHDLWSGWGMGAESQHVDVYTDGSHDASSSPQPTSSWAVTVADDWFHSHFSTIPTDEQILAQQPAHAAGAALFGASIACTRGVYPAELQAIARALAMFPGSCALHIHSDSQAALAGIAAYEGECNERQRLRMAARPLLQLIHHLLAVRSSAQGSVTLSHVKAHTAGADAHSVGNRLSDFQANRARQRPDRPQPLCLRELPVAECENHLTATDSHGSGLMLIDDIRRAALARLQSLAMTHWTAKIGGQGELAGEAMTHLGRDALRHGSAQQQSTLVHVATNSVEFLWLEDAAGGRSSLQRLRCSHCNRHFDLSHLASCPAPDGIAFRSQMRRDILRLLASADCTRDWLHVNSRLELGALLLSLFPIAASTPADEQRRHLARLICGAFTNRQAAAAAKSLGFDSAEAGRATLRQLRLLCLEHIDKVFSDRKEAARA